MRIAVVGTGRMGSAMARSLARGGSDLILQNRTAERAEALANELGASTVATPAEAAAAADVVITMLENQEAVESAWSGPDGLLAGARSGVVLVDMSTVPPSVIQSFASAAANAGAGILDAPVSGSVPLAETGKLTIMAGGSAEDLERARPALEQLATSIHHIGPLGSAAALKLAVNTLIFALNQSVSEALVLAERAGIPREVAYDVFAAGAAGAPYVGYKKAAFLDPSGDARRLLARPRREGPPPHPRAGGRSRRTDAADPRQPGDRSGRDRAVRPGPRHVDRRGAPPNEGRGGSHRVGSRTRFAPE